MSTRYWPGPGCEFAAECRIGDPPEHRAWRQGTKLHPPRIGNNTRIRAYVTVDAGLDRPTQIGSNCFLLTKSHVGHDAILGDNVELATSAIVGGHCVLEDNVKVGLGAVILPYRRIGHGARIGAGSIVTRDVPPGVTVVGNPARVLDPSDRDPRPYTERTAEVHQLEDAA